MSKKSRKTTRVVATGDPSKVEGVVQASAPTRDERPVLSPRPRTDHRTPAAVPAVPTAPTAPAPVADKGVAKGPSAKIAAALPPAPAPRAAAPVAAAPAPRAAAPAAAAPSHAEISRLAQDLWLQRGRPLGQDLDIWCEAERRLTRKS